MLPSTSESFYDPFIMRELLVVDIRNGWFLTKKQCVVIPSKDEANAKELSDLGIR
jgi:hypothetical protein